MIEKLEYYHGAALVRLIEGPRCEMIGKHQYGYRVISAMLCKRLAG
jgi:hypothetical protein